MAGLLNEKYYLPKINFQNYSSQDALNSLIGSPAGYIGCENGELSDKIKKSNVGILLCDEFEKTNKPVFSFFLELLEEGKFTDSLAREYDMDGYIIVFTSNIQNQSDLKSIIPQELQTRFDLICKFEEPSTNDKINFVDYLIDQFLTKFNNNSINVELTEDERNDLKTIDYSKYAALRDIRRIVFDRLITLLRNKGLIE